MSADYRIVVTGFGPFGGILVNSSTTAVLNLQNKWQKLQSNTRNATQLIILPNVEVSYRSVDEVVSDMWNNLKPDLVIHVGVHASSSGIAIETQSGSGPYSVSDGGDLPCELNCRGPICTKLLLDDPYILLQSLGFKCFLSSDPGCFLCSYIYHRSLQNNPDRTLFVHVPSVSDVFTADYLGDFLLLLIIILCKQCDIPLPSSFKDYLQERTGCRSFSDSLWRFPPLTQRAFVICDRQLIRPRRDESNTKSDCSSSGSTHCPI